nr:reverse transcriptase domain-containing protein [Tanacetum cinerariifolium]
PSLRLLRKSVLPVEVLIRTTSVLPPVATLSQSTGITFKVENSNLEEHLPPVVTMADNHTMAELLRAPTEGYAEAIVVPLILAEQFELKHRAARRWLEKEPPCSITTWEDLLSKFINEFFPPSRTTSLRNEISNFQQKIDESFHAAWDRYKDLLRACPYHGFTKLYQLDAFYNALNPADQDSLNAAAGGNLLERINQQTSVVTTAMTTMLKQFQAIPPPAPVKVVEEICVTCGGAHSYYQCLATGGNTFPDSGIISKDTFQQPQLITIRVIQVIVLEV